MRYKKKGAGMPKGAGNGMYMNGGRMYSTGGAVPGGTGPRTFQKINVPEVELSGAAGNPEASKVHEFTETPIPGVFTSNRTPAGQKVFYDENGRQFSPEALRAQAEKSTKSSTRRGAFPQGLHESSESFSSMLPEVMMTNYEKALATRGEQRSAAKRAGTFDPNADYNKIPIPAGYSTRTGYDNSPTEIQGSHIPQGLADRQQRNPTSQYDVTGKNKEGDYARVRSLSDPNQPVYYAGEKEVSPTQMILSQFRAGAGHAQNVMRALEATQPGRAANIKNQMSSYKEMRKKALPGVQRKRNAYDANLAGKKNKK